MTGCWLHGRNFGELDYLRIDWYGIYGVVFEKSATGTRDRSGEEWEITLVCSRKQSFERSKRETRDQDSTFAIADVANGIDSAVKDLRQIVE